MKKYLAQRKCSTNPGAFNFKYQSIWTDYLAHWGLFIFWILWGKIKGILNISEVLLVLCFDYCKLWITFLKTFRTFKKSVWWQTYTMVFSSWKKLLRRCLFIYLFKVYYDVALSWYNSSPHLKELNCWWLTFL